MRFSVRATPPECAFPWHRRLQGGALVHAVAPLRADVGTQECTQIGENVLSTPFLGTCVHYCDAIRDTNRVASCVRWHERLNHHGVPAAPLASPSRLVGKTGSERVALLPGWHLRQGVNPPTFSPDVPLCHPLETARGRFYGLMAV